MSELLLRACGRAAGVYTNVFLGAAVIGVGGWSILTRRPGLDPRMAALSAVAPYALVLAPHILAFIASLSRIRAGTFRRELSAAVLGTALGSAVFLLMVQANAAPEVAGILGMFIAALWTVASPMAAWAVNGGIRKREAASSLYRTAALLAVLGAFRYPGVLGGTEQRIFLYGLQLVLSYDALTGTGIALVPFAAERLAARWSMLPEGAAPSVAEEAEGS